MRKLMFVLLIAPILAQGQQSRVQDLFMTRTKKNWQKAVFVPSVFITAGLIATTDNELLDKHEVFEERNERMPRFHTGADNYLQYAPIAAVYGLNLAGVKGQHDFRNRTALLIKSELIMTAIVFPLKKLTAVPRPDTGTPNSFPSGHTAQAFAAATFLHKEFGHDHPLYSVLAYATATGVGMMRVMNNRHWASDVLAGAGIGILATNIAYLTHHVKPSRHNRHSSADIVVSPTYTYQALGVSMVIGIR
jgi:membrane-associated phospholipid phosphatase